MWFMVLSILFTITCTDGVLALAPDVDAESARDETLDELDVAFLAGGGIVSVSLARFLLREDEEVAEERSVALPVPVPMRDVLGDDRLGERGALDVIDGA